MVKPRSVPNLGEWYVISLRPSGSHAPVRRAAAARGARVFPVSTLRLEPLPASVALSGALACDQVVATSPAAVRFAKALLPLSARPGQAWLAVGAGTGAALRRAGVDEVSWPARRSDSEGLLELPTLHAMSGVDVGLVTAPGGRGLIAEMLAQRGARVHLAEVYRRVPVRPTAARLAQLDDLRGRSAQRVSSAEAWRQRPAVTSSARLAAKLAELGFISLVLADGAAPARMLDALAADVDAGRFR